MTAKTTTARARSAKSTAKSAKPEISSNELFAVKSAEMIEARDAAHAAGIDAGQGLDDAGRNQAKTNDKHAQALARLSGLEEVAVALVAGSEAAIIALGCKEKDYAAQIARGVAGVKAAPVRFVAAARAIAAHGGERAVVSDAALSPAMKQGTTRQAQAFRKVMLAFGVARDGHGKGAADYDVNHPVIKALSA